VNIFFAKYELNVRIFEYVKNEKSNLFTMIFTLTLVVSCEVLGLLTPFVKACWKSLNKVELEVFKI
jgi:hypothetical protein